MDKSYIIENYITRLGNDCMITYGEGAETRTKCILNQLWKKNKTIFEPRHGKIGLTNKDFYMLIFPKSCDTACFDESAVISINHKKYYFVKCEPVYISDVLHYHYCIAGELVEEEQNVFE